MSKSAPRRVVASLFLVVTSIVVIPVSPATASTPILPFKMRFPQESQVTVMHDDFGSGRSGGRRHTGNDLMAPKMTQVFAVAEGIVKTVATSTRAGRYLVIDHGLGWTSTYIHLNNDNPSTDDGEADWSLTVAPGVAEGARVVAGQVIGWVGDSGNAEWTGSHTHFELALDGRAIDPHPYLVDAYLRDHEIYIRSVLLELFPGLREVMV